MCESAVWFEGLGQTHSCRCLRDWLTSDGFTTCLGFACLVAGVTAGTESHALCHPTDCPEMVHMGVVVFQMKVPWCLLCSSWNTEIYTYISNHIKENKQDFFPYQHISSLVSSFELIRFNGKVRNRPSLHLRASPLPLRQQSHGRSLSLAHFLWPRLAISTGLRENGLCPLLGRAARPHRKRQAHRADWAASPFLHIICPTRHLGFPSIRKSFSLLRPDLICCLRNKWTFFQGIFVL